MLKSILSYESTLTYWSPVANINYPNPKTEECVMNEKNYVLMFFDALWSKNGPKGVKGKVSQMTVMSVLQVIASRSDYATGKNSYVSANTIAEIVGLSKADTVYSAIKAAIDQGWLIRTKGNPYSKRGNTYQVVIPRRDDGNAVAEQPKEGPAPQPAPVVEQEQDDSQPVNPVVDPADEPAQQGVAPQALPNPQKEENDPTLMPVAQRANDIISTLCADLRVYLSLYDMDIYAQQLIGKNILQDSGDDQAIIDAVTDLFNSKVHLTNLRTRLKYAIGDLQAPGRAVRPAPRNGHDPTLGGRAVRTEEIQSRAADAFSRLEGE